MQKKIKIIIAILVVMAIVYSALNINYAAIKEVNKEALTTYVAKVNDKINMYIGFDSVVNDGVIKVTTNGKTYDLKYDLSPKPTFTTEFTINKGMSYGEYQSESLAEEVPIIGYISIATANGAKFRDVIMYAMTMYAKIGKASNNYQLVDDVNTSGIVKEDRSDIIYASDFATRGIEYVKDLYSQNSSASDSSYINSYTWTIQKIAETDTSCTIRSKIVINPETNFGTLSEEIDDTAETTTTPTPTPTPVPVASPEPVPVEVKSIGDVSGAQSETTTTPTPTPTPVPVTLTEEPVTYSRTDLSASNAQTTGSNTNSTSNISTTATTTNSNNTTNNTNNNKTIVLPYAGESDMAVVMVVVFAIAIMAGAGYIKHKNI